MTGRQHFRCWRTGMLGTIPVLIGLPLAVACSSDSSGPATPPPPPPPLQALSRPLLLVANKADNSLSVFDPTAQQELRRVPTRSGPHEVAVSPDGMEAYVTDYGIGAVPGNTITVVGLEFGENLGTIPLSNNIRPHGIEVAANGDIWVTTEGSESVLEVDPDERSILRTVPTGGITTHMLVLVESGARLYTANIGSGDATAVDLVAGAAIQSIATGAQAEGIDAAPDGATVYVANRAAGTLSEIDVGTNQVTRTAQAGQFPIRVKIRPDGREAVVSDLNGGELLVIDLPSLQIVRRLQLPAGPIGLLIAPGGRTAYVAMPALDQVAIVDLQTMTQTGTIITRAEPDGLAWVP